MRSLEYYFGVYFPRWCATWEINTKITLSWAHKQFAARVHTLFYIENVAGSCYTQSHIYNGCGNIKVPNMDCFYQNTSRPRQNGRRFADDVFKCIFLSENVWIFIKISSQFVPRGPINNIPSLFQVMAWCWLGYKPLSETMMVKFLTHICVTRLQWVKVLQYISEISLELCHGLGGSFLYRF